MHSYKIGLSYQGTHYYGWQIQPNVKTIQGQLDQALQKICHSDRIKIFGSGRTDAGVHALEQIVRIDMPLKIPGDALVRALNTHLPEDIRTLWAQECDCNFQPVFHAKEKEYHYYFCRPESGGRSLFQREFVGLAPFGCSLDKIHAASGLFVGEYDFVNFKCEGTETRTTVRTIFSLELTEIPILQPQWNPTLVLKIRGNGFLKQMARLIVGTLWEIGRGKVTELELKQALQQVQVKRIGPVAPPEGLYLAKVIY